MIPIYRAKKIDSGELVEGYYFKTEYGGGNGSLSGQTRHYITDGSFSGNGNSIYMNTVDPNTLSISFPNMIDKKSKRIFASLSEDGVGGDILNIHLFTLELGENMGVAEGEKEFNATAIFNEYGLGVISESKREFLVCYAGLHEESVEVIGIHKG